MGSADLEKQCLSGFVEYGRRSSIDAVVRPSARVLQGVRRDWNLDWSC